MNRPIRNLVAVAVGLALTAGASAQGRNAFQVGGISSPGRVNRITDSFRSHSYSLSPGAGATVDNNLLRSSAGAFNINRTGSSSVGTLGSSMPGFGAPQSTMRTLYQGGSSFNASRMGPIGGSVMHELRGDQPLRTVTVAEAFGVPDLEMIDRDQPMRSFVPITAQGEYPRLMRDGEGLMREGRYFQALEQFRQALSITRDEPEIHLSIVHGALAMGHYNTAAYHIQEAMRLEPRLGRAPISIRSFYGSAAEFVSVRDRLLAQAQQRGQAGELWLALAYFHWFEGRRDPAEQALDRAIAHATSPAMIETIEQFRQDGRAQEEESAEASDSQEAPDDQPSAQERVEAPDAPSPPPASAPTDRSP